MKKGEIVIESLFFKEDIKENKEIISLLRLA